MFPRLRSFLKDIAHATFAVLKARRQQTLQGPPGVEIVPLVRRGVLIRHEDNLIHVRQWRR